MSPAPSIKVLTTYAGLTTTPKKGVSRGPVALTFRSITGHFTMTPRQGALPTPLPTLRAVLDESIPDGSFPGPGRMDGLPRASRNQQGIQPETGAGSGPAAKNVGLLRYLDAVSLEVVTQETRGCAPITAKYTGYPGRPAVLRVWPPLGAGNTKAVFVSALAQRAFGKFIFSP
ncbi:hypothetical protein MTsPCn3_17780 [Erythrobacter sp. MTPC3]